MGGDRMVKKNEASPETRVNMAARWEKARADCALEVCEPEKRFHAKGCDRRRAFVAGDKKAADTPPADASFPPAAPLAGLLTQAEAEKIPDVEKYVVSYETSPLDRRSPYHVKLTADEQDMRNKLMQRLEKDMIPPAPARPWWQFWKRGRRG
jgi:hypothetical protein